MVMKFINLLELRKLCTESVMLPFCENSAAKYEENNHEVFI